MADKKKDSNKAKDADSGAGVAPMPTPSYNPVMPGYSPMVAPGPANAAPKVDFEKMKDKLENFKKTVVKKFPYTIALGIIPPQANMLIEEDEALPKEVSDTKPLYTVLLIPEENYKDIPKIKPEILKMVKESGQNLWVLIKTPVDLWNYGLDSKFELVDAMSAMFPLHDKGFLGALRVANIHKSLVLRKFEKYVASYVIGGSLVRGTATKESDVDVFVIIDDTDVKRMSRVELLEKLRGIILDYVREAGALAGVKNLLSPQIYLMTDFWQSVKDAHPVMFTFIRDGVPFYDRGTFIPWKRLLQMGKIKPSQEAIDLYVKQGEQTEEIVNRRLLDAMVDIYYGILTPTQAMMMLAGMAPPTHKESPKVFREEFFEKKKLVEEKYVKILEKAINLFRSYEYGTLKKFSGTELDKLMEEGREYNKMIKGLQTKIEKNMREKNADEIYENVFHLLKTLFGNKSQSELMEEFESKVIKKGKMQPRFSKIMKEVVHIKKHVKEGKLTQRESESAKRDALELINGLVEYAQRSDLIKAKKDVIAIKYNGRKAELVILGKDAFIIEGTVVKKVEGDKLVPADQKKFEEDLKKTREDFSLNVPSELLVTLKKILGDFELSF
ncbi:MAG: nucleotidyltransferase domain-containing protein [archaeon]